jgi:uncharacterized iron-regulated membrane protein
LKVSDILERAKILLPEANTIAISLPTKPEGVYRFNKQYPENREDWQRSQIYFGQYTGKVLKVKDGRSLSTAETVLNSFTPMHYGKFGGLPTRILYIFVGLSRYTKLITHI